MKALSLLSALVISICLTGCENAELIDCQQKSDTLQSQLAQANKTIDEKNSQIEALKSENTDMQKKAIESITTIMTKQAEKDKELKENLDAKTQQVKELKMKVAEKADQIKKLEAKVADLEAKIAADDEEDDDNEDE